MINILLKAEVKFAQINSARRPDKTLEYSKETVAKSVRYIYKNEKQGLLAHEIG